MADKYLDHGAYGAANRLGLDTPVWGVPQEGDGTAKTAATTSGTAFISFSAVPTSGTFSVCGVTISTTSVLNAASADAAANALATNINATTTAVAAGVSANLPQLRNLVYARGPAGGAPSGTCQIMMRVGSALLDYANNAACLIATTANNVSSTATNHQFAGGSGGCWGWIANPTAIGAASSIGVFAYGPFSANSLIAGFINNGDVVHFRSNKLLLLGAAFNVVMRSYGTDALPVEFRIDDGTEWVEDASLNGVVEFRQSVNNVNMALAMPLTGRMIFRAKKYANGARSLLFSAPVVGASGQVLSLGLLTGGHAFYNLEFVDAGGGTYSAVVNGSTANNDFYKAPTFYSCVFRNTAGRQMFAPGGGANSIFNWCEFSTIGASVATNPVFGVVTASYISRIILRSCKFTGYVSGSSLLPATNLASLIAENCDFGDITNIGNCHINQTTYLQPTNGFRLISLSSNIGLRPFYYEVPQGILEWSPSKNQPVLSSVLPDGVSKLSLRVQPSTVSTLVSKNSPFEVAKIPKKNTLGTTRLRIIVEVAIDSTMTDWTSEDVYVSVTYENASGTIITDGGAPAFGSGTPLQTSTAEWYPQDVSGNPFYGAFTYLKRKIVIETTDQVKPDGEVAIGLYVSKNAATAAQFVFVDLNPPMEAIV